MFLVVRCMLYVKQCYFYYICCISVLKHIEERLPDIWYWYCTVRDLHCLVSCACCCSILLYISLPDRADVVDPLQLVLGISGAGSSSVAGFPSFVKRKAWFVQDWAPGRAKPYLLTKLGRRPSSLVSWTTWLRAMFSCFGAFQSQHRTQAGACDN